MKKNKKIISYLLFSSLLVGTSLNLQIANAADAPADSEVKVTTITSGIIRGLPPMIKGGAAKENNKYHVEILRGTETSVPATVLQVGDTIKITFDYDSPNYDQSEDFLKDKTNQHNLNKNNLVVFFYDSDKSDEDIASITQSTAGDIIKNTTVLNVIQNKTTEAKLATSGEYRYTIPAAAINKKLGIYIIPKSTYGTDKEGALVVGNLFSSANLAKVNNEENPLVNVDPLVRPSSDQLIAFVVNKDTPTEIIAESKAAEKSRKKAPSITEPKVGVTYTVIMYVDDSDNAAVIPADLYSYEWFLSGKNIEADNSSTQVVITDDIVPKYTSATDSHEYTIGKTGSDILANMLKTQYKKDAKAGAQGFNLGVNLTPKAQSKTP